MSTRTLTGVRASELARCPRQAALRGLGADPAEPSQAQQRYMSRGVWFGLYVYEQFAAKYGRRFVEREVAIPWGDGWEGHADILVKSERLIVEVVSSVSPDGLLPAKIRQARQYLHFAQQAGMSADKAAIYVVNPSNLDREDLIPVLLGPEDRDQINADVEAVRSALAGGPLPDCCASSPTECRRSLMCPFTDAAWAGWTPPAAVDLSGDTEAVELAQRLYAVKRRRERRGAEEAADSTEQKELQTLLVARGLVPKLPYTVGSIQFSYSTVKGRETFSASKARAAGFGNLLDSEPLAVFGHVGEPSLRFNVKRVDGLDTGTIDDYGDDAPF